MRALVLVMVACGATVPASIENRAAPPARPTCSQPRLAAIAKHLSTRWRTAEELDLRCAAGIFPIAGYFIEARTGTTRRVGVVSAEDFREIVPFTDEVEPMTATSVIDYATADLDGDGIDEIVESWRKSAHGMLGAANWLVIRRIQNRTLESIDGPHTTVDHPELGGCVAEVKLAGRTLVVTVEVLPGIPPSDCLTQGTHTFALLQDAVVETRR